MRSILVCTAILLASAIGAGGEQGAAKTLVAVFGPAMRARCRRCGAVCAGGGRSS